MNNSHLFDESTFSGLPGSQKKQFQFPPGISLVLPQLFFYLSIDPFRLFSLFAEAATHFQVEGGWLSKTVCLNQLEGHQNNQRMIIIDTNLIQRRYKIFGNI